MAVLAGSTAPSKDRAPRERLVSKVLVWVPASRPRGARSKRNIIGDEQVSREGRDPRDNGWCKIGLPAILFPLIIMMSPALADDSRDLGVVRADGRELSNRLLVAGNSEAKTGAPSLALGRESRRDDVERIKAFCIDFNWGPSGFAPPGMYTNASARKHLAWYRAMGVNTIQTFCVSCPGYAWYHSEAAPAQPGMQGEFLKEITELGHAAGMRVMGYFCIGANAYWSATRPEWSHPMPDCIAIPFTTEYLDYLGKVIPEAVKRTGIDGFMIDWVFNASHFYPNKTYRWLDCEKTMHQELFGEPFPGDEAMNGERVNEFNRRALDRCWERIRTTAKSAKPDCIIWLSCYDLQHPQVAGSRMLREVDWVMNEHPDPAKLDLARKAVGPNVKLIQCICGWGDQHNAAAIAGDPRFRDIGLYGFARPDEKTTLPPEDGSGNARNIAAMRKAFNGGK